MTSPAPTRPTYPLAIRGAVLHTVSTAQSYASAAPITIEDLALSAPGANEVLIRIEAASVCHSDLSVVNGSRPRPLPILLGHEAAGIVVDTGPGVDDLPVGQRVITVFLPQCENCSGCATDGRQPCVPGSAANVAGHLLSGSIRLSSEKGAIHHHLGVSGFATHAVIDRRSLVAVDDDVPPAVAALLGCAMLTGGGAVLNVAEPNEDSVVAVVGLGGVGMAALITARALGVQNLIAIDQVSDKLDIARVLGATQTYTPAEVAATEVVADLVIEAAGHAQAFETAVDVTGPGGTMVTVGLPPPGARSSVDPLAVTAQAKRIQGCYLGSAVPTRDIPKFVELWRAGKLDIEALVSDTIGLDDLNVAMERLERGLALRQVILFAD